MIAKWMLSALLFTALLGATAYFAEVALRGARRPTRAPWLFALAAAVVWPVIAPLARRLLPSDVPALSTAMLQTIEVVPDRLPTTISWTPWLDTLLIVLWTMTSGVMIVRLARAYVYLARIRRASERRVVDGVPVLVSDDIGPAVVGVLQPSVLLPAALLDLDAPLRRLVLRHEEEHCRARDPLIVIGSAVALALVPWNLPLWWIVRRARLAVEVDCDARVLAIEPGTTQYGKLLLLISQRPLLTPYAPMLAASRSDLERRIAAMLPIRANGRRTKIVVALLATVVAGIAACNSRIADVVTPRSSVAQPSPTVSAQPYFEFQVEKQAQQLPGIGNVRYPDSLRTANVQGVVLAQFVVDERGEVEPGTFRALQSDHPLFSNAVERALPAMRFSAAEIAGTKVRQLVQQPFTFSLSRTVAPRQNLGDVTSRRGNDRPSADRAIDDAIRTVRQRIEQQAPNAEARQIPVTGNVRYPAALRSPSVQGEVLAQVVVDATGKVLPGSFKIRRSSHARFTAVAKE